MIVKQMCPSGHTMGQLAYEPASLSASEAEQNLTQLIEEGGCSLCREANANSYPVRHLPGRRYVHDQHSLAPMNGALSRRLNLAAFKHWLLSLCRRHCRN